MTHENQKLPRPPINPISKAFWRLEGWLGNLQYNLLLDAAKSAQRSGNPEAARLKNEEAARVRIQMTDLGHVIRRKIRN